MSIPAKDRVGSRLGVRARRLAVVNLLEDPGRFYWKWLAIAAVLLIVYAIERSIRDGALF